MKIYSDLTKNSVLGLRSLADFLEKEDLKNVPESIGVDFVKNVDFYFSCNNDPIPKNFTKEDLINVIMDCFKKMEEDYDKLLFVRKDLEKELKRCETGLKKAKEKNLRSIKSWEGKLSEVQVKINFVRNNISCFDECNLCRKQKKVGFKVWFYNTVVKSVAGYNIYLLPVFILKNDLDLLYFKIYKYRKEKYINKMFTRETPNRAYFMKFIPFKK